jgi:hypothetical protein
MTEVLADTRTKAWLLLVIALAMHVTDEALTGFLEFYNPLVSSLRARWWWFPMPVFTFGVWLGGLIIGVIALLLLTPLLRRDTVWIRVIASLFGIMMFLNGLGHLGGSIYFGRWLPGTTTAPLLLAASAWLLNETWRNTRRVGERRESTTWA